VKHRAIALWAVSLVCVLQGCAPREAGQSARVKAGTAREAAWEHVPLRTADQKAKGMRGGEMGQMAFTLAICAQHPNCMAMGIDTAAAYVSEDGGNNWELRRRGIHTNGVQSIAFDPVNKNVLWAAGLRSAAGTQRSFPPDPKYYDKKADGIYRSDDLGKSWKLVRNAAFLRGHGQNRYFAFDPKGATPRGCQIVFAATHDDGLLRTEDGGSTWTAVGPKGILNAVIRHPKTGQMWLAAEEGLWLSSDHAKAWTELKTPALPVKGIVIHPNDPKIAYLALGKSGVWRTVNAGQSWEECSNGLPRQNWTQLAMSPVRPEIMYADATRWGGPLPYYSHDGGKTWHGIEEREAGFYGAGVYWAEGLVAHPTEPLVAFHLHPLRITTDGGKTWRLLASGVSGSRRGARTAIAFRPDDPKKMAFFYTDHGCSLTEDGGDTWAYVPAPRQADIGAKTMPGGAYDPTPGSKTVVSAVGGWYKQRLCTTHNDGQTWRVFKDMEDNYVFFAWHPQHHKVVYVGTARGGLRSDDAGRTWKAVGKPIRAMFPADGDTVYAVTRLGRGRHLVERSTDRGESWNPLGKEVRHGVGEIDVDPRDPDRVYAATAYGGIMIYDGKTWTARGEADGLEKDFFGAMIFRKLAVDPRRPGVVYAGQNHSWRGAARGIFRSTDYGRTWNNVNRNLGPALTVWSIAVSPHDSTVWLGTDYGNWRMRQE